MIIINRQCSIFKYQQKEIKIMLHKFYLIKGSAYEINKKNILQSFRYNRFLFIFYNLTIFCSN